MVIETGRYRIEGELTLPREGYRSRLSDFVNQRDREFFSLSNVKVRPLDNPKARAKTVPFIMIARTHVTMITPEQPPTDA